MEKAQVLRDWIEREGRKQTWVARQVECSPQWLNYVLRGKKPMSDKLAGALYEKLGIPLYEGEFVRTKSTRKLKRRIRQEDDPL